jgi:tetratricopeptide (TPR) repeat protein
MNTYVDALGLVAAAIVFAVGLMSARLHGTFDALVRQTVDLSWTARVRIMEGHRVTPADVDELTSAIGDDADPVAWASLALNRLLLVVGVAIAVTAMISPTAAGDAPHVKELIALLFAACLGVELLGELDRCLLRKSRKKLIANATLSRLSALGKQCDDQDDEEARKTLRALRADFPAWGLLREVDAFLRARDGDAEQALATIRSLLAEPAPDIYLAPVVGVHSAVAVSGDWPALTLLDEIVHAEPSVPHAEPLRLALRLRLAHLDALLAGDLDPAHPRWTGLAWAQVATREAVEAGRGGARTGLDLTPSDLEETWRLIRLTASWSVPGEHLDGDALDPRSPLQRVLAEVLPGEVPSRLWARSDPGWDGGTHETLGVLALCRGEAREALAHLETAARLSPAAARPQWWIAIACRRLNWTDAAQRALARSEILDGDDPLTEPTRSWLAGAGDDDGAVPARDAIDRLRAAIIGLPLASDAEAAGVAGPSSVAEQFMEALMALARTPVPTTAPIAAVGDG